jgi:hypothetical protein
MRVSLVVALVAIYAFGYYVVWFYWKGRNWARLLVLTVSVLSVLNLVSLASPRTTNPAIVGVWGILDAFFLYWLNTGTLREFFNRSRLQ